MIHQFEQRELSLQERITRNLPFWKQNLADLPPPLTLPAYSSQPGQVPGKKARVDIALTTSCLNNLVFISNQLDAGLSETILTAFYILLYRYTNQYDIIIGSIMDVSSVSDAVKSAKNQHIIPLRADLSGNPAFNELVKKVHMLVSDAQEHAIPFSFLEEKIKLPAGTKSPLFKAAFSFKQVASQTVTEDALTGYESGLHFISCDLALHVEKNNDGLKAYLEYNSNLIDAATLERMAENFQVLLNSIAASYTQHISLLPLLTQNEQNQLLYKWNSADIQLPEECCILSVFEDQVKCAPGNLAVVFKEEELTYAVLNARANQVARFLCSKGIKPETLVPVCIDRSADMVVWILGILKAGAAYVPVDPESPAERINYLLQDTGARLVVTSQAHGAKLTRGGEFEIIETEKVVTQINLQPTDNPAINIEPRHLAYVIYTSGSTGRPKGVMVEHVSLYNYLINSKTNYINAGQGGTGSFIHLSYTFDASLTALFMPLLSGKAVVIGSEKNTEVFQDPNLRKYMPYDFIKATPAHLELLAATIKDNSGWLTNKLVIGGEALHLNNLKQFKESGISVEIINEYGPTEATVGCSTFSFYTNGDNDNITHSIPIGKPIDNTLIYIVNESNQLAPTGVAGEICIGGAGIARGYLNHSGLTAEKFIKNPFSRNGSLYKTGDTGRWLPDGNIEYIGRKDDQVKVMGYRIELGEVESVFNNLECISSSCVVVKKDKNDNKKLSGYYIPDSEILKAKTAELYRNRVESWKELYEIEYGKTEEEPVTDEEYNLAGWNDSFTGKAIAEEQMREWLEDITAVILSGGPKHVLEIGCGMGLIYYQLADKVDKYTGTDFSESSIRQISKRIKKGLRNYCKTQLKVCAAHEVIIADKEQPDTIIINSVAQYFPGKEYMTGVIEQAVAGLKGNGRIIIGDVRDNRLNELFQSRLAMNKMPHATPVNEFKWAVEQHVLKEEELCFDPEYFYRLPAIYPEITHVDIQWKNAGYSNELSLYRYTVIIYVGAGVKVTEPLWQIWAKIKDKQNIARQLEHGYSTIALKDVPNTRLWHERLLHDALNDKDVHTVGDLLNYIKEGEKESQHTVNLIALAQKHGYRYKLLLNEDALNVNVLIYKNFSDGFVRHPAAELDLKPEISLTNNPLFADISLLLQGDIKSLLLQRLPRYMVPTEFVAVTKFPLTVNGKIDRNFLSSRDERKILKQASGHAEPSSAEEKQLVKIWQDILGADKVSIRDNFFEIGGNSLQAFRMFSKIGKAFGQNVPLGLLIKAPTVEQLAVLLNKPDARRWSCLVPIQADGTKPPMFCVHGGWGHVLFYRQLAQQLGSDQPLYGLQVKGLNGQDKPFYTMSDMAAHYIAEIQSVQPKGPYYLGGYCYGAIVAFEMARQLSHKGEEIALLVNFNGVSPVLLFPQNFTKITEGTAAVPNEYRHHQKNIRHLTAGDTALNALKKLKNKAGSLKRNTRPAYLKLKLGMYMTGVKIYKTFKWRLPEQLLKLYVFDALHKSQSTYIPGTFNGRMVIFRSAKFFRDPFLGWSTLISGNIKTFDVPGDHINRIDIMHEPNVQYIAGELKNYLAKDN